MTLFLDKANEYTFENLTVNSNYLILLIGLTPYGSTVESNLLNHRLSK